MRNFYLFFLGGLMISFQTLAGDIIGVVKDAVTLEPLAGVSVVIKDSKLGAFTDQAGKFLIADLKSGKYMLIASSVGYVPSSELTAIVQEKGSTELIIFLTPQVHGLSEIHVIGKRDKESDESARMSEKNADNVINVVSSKTIDRSPDITVANVAQRVSGVTIDRSTGGQSQYAIIRGMEQRYNNTLINGVKIPSPDPTSRFVPLDIIPSDLLQRLEVTKALTADMEGDAIGGTINAIMKDAPDTTLISAQLSTGYNQLFMNNKYITYDNSTVSYKDPDQLHGHYYLSTQNDFTRKNLNFTSKQAAPNLYGNFSFGRRFYRNKIGALVSLSNQNTISGSKSETVGIFINQQNHPQETNDIDRYVTSRQNRFGANLKLDFVLNQNYKINFYSLFLKAAESQSRIFSDTLMAGNGRYGPGTGYVSVAQRSRFYIQQVENHTLQGKHSLRNNLSVDWSAVYSKAGAQTPDMAEVSTYHTVTPGGSYLGKAEYLSNIVHTWQKNLDEDVSGYLNLDFKPSLFKKTVAFRAGALYRTKFRNNYQNDYTLKPQLDSSNKDPIYKNINTIQVYPYQPIGNPEYNTSNYTAHEIINAYYLQSKVNFGALNVIGGIRYEMTQQNNFNKTIIYPGYKKHYFYYNDLLPSLHLKYLLSSRQNLRLSYFKSISRPNYFEIVDFTSRGDDANTTGNPKLRHVQAHNFDLRYEFFPTQEETFMAGAFYKKIVDPIERSLISNGGQKSITYNNFGIAYNYGFELVAIKYFGDFGVSANYTFTNSQISSLKTLYYKNGEGKDTVGFFYEKRPMQGQSRQIANLSILYRNPKKGFNAQLSLLFQGKRISDVSFYYGQDFYQKNYTDLSFSMDKNLLRNMRVFIKLNNLLNTPNTLKTRDNFFIQKYTYQQSYQAGLKWHL